MLIVILSPNFVSAVTDLHSASSSNNGTKKGTNLVVVGPPKIITSKPTGHYTDFINGTFVSVGKPKVITSKPTGKYTNGTSLVTVGPTQTITSNSTGKYTNGTSLVTVGKPKVITSKPTGKYTNGTSLVTVGKPVVSKLQQLLNHNNVSKGFQTIRGATPSGQNLNNINSPTNNIASKPITKEEAQKAEEQADVMLKAYNEKANQQAGAAVKPPVTTTMTNTTTTTNSSQQQKPQQPVTQENSSSAATPSAPTGIPGIP